MANASGGPPQNRHDKSMALFTMFFRPFFGALGGGFAIPRVRGNCGRRPPPPGQRERQLRYKGGWNPVAGREESVRPFAMLRAGGAKGDAWCWVARCGRRLGMYTQGVASDT